VIEDLLAADPALLKAVSGLLDRAPTEVGATDKSVHIGRDSSGPVVTGDGNVVFGR
jgi:hypothetical protein